MTNTNIVVNDKTYIYTTLHEAQKEIHRRWNDPQLREKVKSYWGQDFDLLAQNGPSGCLGRNIISPNNELRYFYGLCEEISIKPLFIEHNNDKFVSSNPDKYHLAKMYFYDGRGKKNGSKFSAKSVVDIASSDGHNISSMKTLWGESFVEFHHRILRALFPSATDNIVDIASISKLKNKKLSSSYDSYLSVFVYFGILFENYLPHKSKSNFFNVVCRAFDQVEKEFKVRPLIVPLSPMEDQDDLFWWSYPEALKKVLINKN